MKFYKMTKEEVLEILDTEKTGLTDKKVIERHKKYGFNELNLKKKKSKIKVFFEQFKDVLVIILILSAIVSIFTDSIESAIVILLVLFINAMIGTIQYFKAEKTLESLTKLSSPTVKVIRNNQKIEINSRELTIGDIVIFSSGDVLCSDGRIIEGNNVEVNESSITGESCNVEKEVEAINKDEVLLAEQKNMVFSSSEVVKGQGKYVVTKIGMKTEIGKIAEITNKEETKKSPLQKSLDDFSKALAVAIILICVIVFGINVYRHISIMDSLMFSVSLAVAAIPEALSAIVTIVLAIGTRELAMNKAVMKDIKSVETLGAVSHIFSDKTGTITTGKLVIHSLYNGYSEGTSIKLNREFMNAIIYCNSIEKEITFGDEIEKCLYYYLIDRGFEISRCKENKKICYLNFDSTRKMMSVSLDYELYVKGAPEKIISLCKSFNGITKEDAERKLREYTNKGFRVIAYAYKGLYKEKHDYSDENSFVFLGLVAFYDPPRENVKEAIELCKKAQVVPIMITGDNLDTAKYIAKDIGIFNPQTDEAISGMELEKLNNEELLNKIEKIKVYARVSPTDKIRIVETMQSKGKIVAMTGDGINDAPALKKANVGVSMGIKGTEVAKEASSVILTDDNFYTIINAISIGRKIHSSIQNAIRFLIAGNAAGIMIVLLTTILLLPIPFAPVHLLFINLLTDSLPAISLGLEKPSKDYLNEKPRNPKSKILSRKVFYKTIIEAFLIGSVVIIGYFLGLRVNQYYAQTYSFLILSLTRLLYSFNCRSDKPIIKQKLDNHLLNLSVVIGVILVVLVTFIPFLKNVFFVSDIAVVDFLIILGLSVSPTIIIQSYCFIKYLIRKNKKIN